MKLLSDLMRRRNEKLPEYPKGHELTKDEEREQARIAKIKRCAEVLFSFFGAPSTWSGARNQWEAPKQEHKRSLKVRKMRRAVHRARMRNATC